MKKKHFRVSRLPLRGSLEVTNQVRPELNLRAHRKRVRGTLRVSPKGFCYEPVNLLTGRLR